MVAVRLQPDAEIGRRRRLENKGAHFKDRDGKNLVGTKLGNRLGETVREAAADNVDALAVRRQDVELLAVGSFVANPQDEGRGVSFRFLGGGGVGGKKSDGEVGLIEAVVRQRLIVFGEIVYAETGNVFQQLEILDDAIDRIRFGGPLERLSEIPTIAALHQLHGLGRVHAGDFERLNVGHLRTQHPAPGFERGALGPPVSFEFKDEEKQRDVQEN